MTDPRRDDRERLPEPVRDYLGELGRLEPPADLLDGALDRIAALPAPRRRFPWVRGAALAAGAVAVAVVAVVVVGGGLLTDDRPPGASTSPVPTPLELSPPPLDALPVAGTVEATFPIPPGTAPALHAHGSLWLTSDPPATLTRIDPATGDVLATIELSTLTARRYNTAPVSDGRWIWASAGGDETIVRIDPQTNEIVDRYPVEAAGYQMLATGTDVWMTDFELNVLVRIDADTGAVISRTRMPIGPAGIALTDEGLWVSIWNAPRLLLFDPDTMEQLAEYRIAENSIKVEVSGDSLYISGNAGRPAERFSIPERRVVAQTEEMNVVLLADRPWGMTFDGRLVRLDPATLAWQAGRQVDMAGCDCDSLVAGTERLYIGTGAAELVVIAP